MGEDLTELVRKIYGLLELLAEEKIAIRDAKQRASLRQLVGASPTKQESVFLMDGAHTQSQIRKMTGVNQGNFSAMVGKLQKANLLAGDVKTPKLSISIPTDFFETHE